MQEDMGRAEGKGEVWGRQRRCRRSQRTRESLHKLSLGSSVRWDGRVLEVQGVSSHRGRVVPIYTDLFIELSHGPCPSVQGTVLGSGGTRGLC